ncbi:MAG TPA: hypothetical protein PKC40_01805 [Saprospiraceae bacterium]|nr:hypothetical protein [Saprospiraceae bacterium]
MSQDFIIIFALTFFSIVAGYFTNRLAAKKEKNYSFIFLTLLFLAFVGSSLSFYFLRKKEKSDSFIYQVEGIYVAIVSDSFGNQEGAAGDFYVDNKGELRINGQSFKVNNGNFNEIGDFQSLSTEILEDRKSIKYTFKGKEDGVWFGQPGRETGIGEIEFKNFDKKKNKYLTAEGWFINPVSKEKRIFKLLRSNGQFPTELFKKSNFIKLIEDTCKEYEEPSPFLERLFNPSNFNSRIRKEPPEIPEFSTG